MGKGGRPEILGGNPGKSYARVLVQAAAAQTPACHLILELAVQEQGACLHVECSVPALHSAHQQTHEPLLPGRSFKVPSAEQPEKPRDPHSVI